MKAGRRGAKRRCASPTRMPRCQPTAGYRRLEPPYKQHAVVDDVRGVILTSEVTTGETSEGQVIIERIDAAATTAASQ
jgi:hypothetical protein